MGRKFVAASSQYLSIDAAPITAYPFSLCAWAYSNDVTGFYYIAGLMDKDAANVYWMLSFAGPIASDPVRLVSRNTTSQASDSSSGYTAGSWVHVAGVWVSTTERYIYLNGGSVGGGAGLTAVTGPSAVDRISVGSAMLSTPAGYLNGGVGEVGLWNTNLSSGEVAALAVLGTSPLTIQADNLVGYWPLRGVESPEPDESGLSNNPLTVGGATQVVGPWFNYKSVGATSFSAATVKARGKMPMVGGSSSYQSATVKARGKDPLVGGSMAFGGTAVYSNATLYLYTGGASQAYSAGATYEKIVGPAENAYSYVGQGVLVFANGSERTIGRVYERGGTFVFSGGAIYSKTTTGTTYSYAGGGVIVYSGVSVYAYTYNRRIEAMPGVRAASQETKPQRPAGQDGVYTDPTQDGVWDEYPVDGAYADIGYFKEFKPRRRATFTEEGKPN